MDTTGTTGDIQTSLAPARVDRRPWWLTVAAWTCWLVGHLPVIPGVIAWVLVSLCLEVGWWDVLRTKDGMLLALGLFFSGLANITLMLAGLAFYRRQARRGVRLILVTLLAAIPGALPFVRPWLFGANG